MEAQGDAASRTIVEPTESTHATVQTACNRLPPGSGPPNCRARARGFHRRQGLAGIDPEPKRAEAPYSRGSRMTESLFAKAFRTAPLGSTAALVYGLDHAPRLTLAVLNGLAGRARPIGF